MADEKHLEVLQMGKEAWNIWYNPKFRGVADLKGVALACADLSGINFKGAALRNADLRYADLRGADLRSADLRGARLERANLRGANLDRAMGVTAETLYHAEGDKDTQLPKGLKPPVHWIDSAGEHFAIPEPMPST